MAMENKMNCKFLKVFFAGLVLSVSSLANAGLIVEYDYSPASGTTLNASYTASNYVASGLTLNNAANTANAFGNHFYHNGWDATFNANKYYEATISNANLFTFDSLSFALENTSGTSTYWLRSSLDGFAADLATGNFSGGLVTNFSSDLSTLGGINAPVSFRWFIASTTTAGFANHECPGAGCNFVDVGQDLQFFAVPEPSTLAIFALGLMGLISRRFKK